MIECSETTTAILAALVDAAPDLASIPKTKKGYGYSYAPLDVLIDMLRTALPKHGLWFFQAPGICEDGSYELITRVVHKSGEWIEQSLRFAPTELAKGNDAQKIGASITYFRRYSLASLFGIAADEDTDAAQPAASQPAHERAKRQANPVAQDAAKMEPKAYLSAYCANRQRAGVSYADAMAELSEMAQIKNMPPLVDDLTDQEAVRIARALWIREKQREALK